MTILQQPEEFRGAGQPVCAAIGVFDGVHIGHQRVLDETVAAARRERGIPVAITFDVHPKTVIAPDHCPSAIYPLHHKLALLQAQGIAVTWLIRFDHAFSQLSARDFIERLRTGFAPLRALTVGRAFTFGHRRGGDVALLQELGRQYGFTAEGLSARTLDHHVVSSTAIRQLIRSGDFLRARQMLGRPYTLIATVRHGQGLGRQIGAPTANLDTAALVTPPPGVYAARVHTHGLTRAAVLNIGFRPTVQAEARRETVEVHLLDFDGDLYDQTLEVEFVRRLRDEARFSSTDALRAQIQADILQARQIIGASAAT
jgi:riboflavin kinase/FMN adenylyltransferase